MTADQIANFERIKQTTDWLNELVGTAWKCSKQKNDKVKIET